MDYKNMKPLRVALLQMCSKWDIPENLATIENLLNQDHSGELDPVVLPECFARIGGSVIEASENAPAIREWMSGLAKQYSCWLVGGSTPVSAGNSKSYSSCFVYDPQGNEIACYKKMALPQFEWVV